MDADFECQVCLESLCLKVEEDPSSDAEEDFDQNAEDPSMSPFPVLLQCGHVLHRKCITQSYRANPRERRCPICRTLYSRRLSLKLRGFKRQLQVKSQYLVRLGRIPEGNLSSKQIDESRENISVLNKSIPPQETRLEKKNEKKGLLQSNLNQKKMKSNMNRQTMQQRLSEQSETDTTANNDRSPTGSSSPGSKRPRNE